MWKDLAPEQKEQIFQAAKGGAPLTVYALQLGIKESSLERYLRTYRNQRDELLTKKAQTITIPASTSRLFTDYITLENDNVMIIGDLEIPDHHEKYLYLSLLMAMEHNLKTLIILGDLVATDHSALNLWAKLWVTGQELPYENCIAQTNALLTQLSAWYDEIIVVAGNHDERINRATGGAVHLGMLLNSPKVRYSHYSYLWLETSRGPVKCIHPKNYRADPITLAQQLYNREPRKAHTVIAHTHRMQTGKSPDGQYTMQAIGCMRQRQRTQYVSTHVSNHKQWDNSLLMIRNGFQYNIDCANTDWQFWLGGRYPAWMTRVKYQEPELVLS